MGCGASRLPSLLQAGTSVGRVRRLPAANDGRRPDPPRRASAVGASSCLPSSQGPCVGCGICRLPGGERRMGPDPPPRMPSRRRASAVGASRSRPPPRGRA
ncbi:hypothetical protein PAHAL_3G129000 [Panicum hallii]|uniref:Uncharacterized protein n=1 Tax=Panicum hallii TaxID=206008 RepID=A0A2T8KI08_9POAL|nr:hypothetical protein PAHAL_3G129000 [Panicum hallii]